MTDEKPKLRLASKTKSSKKTPLRQTHPVHPAIHELAKILAHQAVCEYLGGELAEKALKKETKP